MSVASRLAQSTDGFRGGTGTVQQTIGSLFAGEVEILLMIEAELESELEAEVEAEISAEIVQIIEAETCS